MTRQQIAELREQRATAYHRMQAVLAEMRNGTMTGDQQRSYDSAEREFDALTDQIELAGESASGRSFLEAIRAAEGFAPGCKSRAARSGSEHFLGADQRLADWVAERGLDDGLGHDVDPADLHVGRLVRGMATGNWDGAELERRALGSGSDATGGVLVASPLAAGVIDMLRNEARVIEAGAQIVPMESGELSIPRLASGFDAASFRDELEPVAEDDGVFERVKFDAKTLATILTLPYELAEDMTDAGAGQIETAIRAALALKLDQVALYGGGPKEPLGVKMQAHVPVEAIAANGAAPTNYAPFVKAYFAVRRANAQPNAFIYSERTAETVAGFEDTTGQPLNPPRAIAEIPHLSTNQVPDTLDQGTATDVASDLFTGDFSQLWIGVRPQLGIRVERHRIADNMAVKILAYLRADVQLAHPKAFHVTTGLLAS